MTDQWTCRRCGAAADEEGSHHTLVHMGLVPGRFGGSTEQSWGVLCQSCWSELTPQQRLPFYLAAFDEYIASDDWNARVYRQRGEVESRRASMEAAVLMGL
jgi:hypothetical protein